MIVPLVLGAVVLFLTYQWLKSQRPRNFPPGPPAIPLLGNLLSLGSKPAVKLMEWRQKYGDIFGMYNGRQPMVVISDFHTLRKIFGEDSASGRRTHSVIRRDDSSLPMGIGLLGSQGDPWKTHRRFALSTLRDLGMSKNWLEDTIIAEIEDFCQTLRDTKLRPFDPKVQLTNSVANVICALSFGKRFEMTDSKFSNGRAARKQAPRKDLTICNWSDRSLTSSLRARISTTVLWAMVFMIENPDVMERVQAEIDDKVGRQNVLTNSDRSRLPYTEAVILESQRCGNLVPLGVPHYSMEEIQLDGYTIPKDTLLISNLFAIHRDARYWKNPEKFDPNRFLNSEQKLIRPDGFVPFSIGKRTCLGEALAKMELFLFIANLLRCFTLELPKGKTLSHDDYYSSLVDSPDSFALVFVPRF
ncbi:putative Cytochrome P450 18a1 [Hypsibius exemplaris]|uniref:Cytochrome P450 18a1 n=1 Tax=Hypsibius exemplaris TaxID=2072580 RepID=A0A1W0WLT3_HYPEX|nr:putative Cytochrome P450 18a1 [Hypsibius exemplaris]